MPLLSESPIVLPIHRKILAFSFIGWIFDFYDLLLLSFLVASTIADQGPRAVARRRVGAARHRARVHRGRRPARRRARRSLRPQAAADDHDPHLQRRHAALGHGDRHVVAARSRARSPASASAASGRSPMRWSARPCRRTCAAATARTCRAAPRSRASSRRWSGILLAPWIGWRAAFMVSALPALHRRLHPQPHAGVRRLAAESAQGASECGSATCRVLGADARSGAAARRPRSP